LFDGKFHSGLALKSWTFLGSRYRDKVYDDTMISLLLPLAPMTQVESVLSHVSQHETPGWLGAGRGGVGEQCFFRQLF